VGGFWVVCACAYLWCLGVCGVFLVVVVVLVVVVILLLLLLVVEVVDVVVVVLVFVVKRLTQRRLKLSSSFVLSC